MPDKTRPRFYSPAGLSNSLPSFSKKEEDEFNFKKIEEAQKRLDESFKVMRQKQSLLEFVAKVEGRKPFDPENIKTYQVNYEDSESDDMSNVFNMLLQD